MVQLTREWIFANQRPARFHVGELKFSLLLVGGGGNRKDPQSRSHTNSALSISHFCQFAMQKLNGLQEVEKFNHFQSFELHENSILVNLFVFDLFNETKTKIGNQTLTKTRKNPEQNYAKMGTNQMTFYINGSASRQYRWKCKMRKKNSQGIRIKTKNGFKAPDWRLIKFYFSSNFGAEIKQASNFERRKCKGQQSMWSIFQAICLKFALRKIPKIKNWPRKANCGSWWILINPQ